MFDFENMAVDPTLAEEGVWMPYLQGAEFKIARPGRHYTERLVELFREHKQLIESGTPEGDQKAAEIQKLAYAECVLRDWRGVYSGGVEVPYSQEAALKILLDVRQFEFHQWLDRVTIDRTVFQAKADEEVVDTVKSSAVS